MTNAKQKKQFRALGIEVMSIYFVPIYLGLAIERLTGLGGPKGLCSVQVVTLENS